MLGQRWKVLSTTAMHGTCFRNWATGFTVALTSGLNCTKRMKQKMKNYGIFILMAYTCGNINSQFSKLAHSNKEMLWQARFLDKVPQIGTLDVQ